jgi:alkanesulfonate monooxygenase SsuD/methylene tetrahydromethanopterin reductase-like flavin-dependent oxidoreductase (luciferase family)
MSMDFGVEFMSYPGCWDDVAFAEQHGISVAGFVESPMLAADPYICMALAAKATNMIRLGACLSIPGLRTAPTAAAGLATVNSIAPGRVWLGTGTGLTGRMCLGVRALAAWKIRDFACEVRGLLAGEEVVHRIGKAERRIRFRQPKALRVDPEQPIPIYIAADGPKALQAAAEGADGMISGLTAGSAMGNCPEVFANEMTALRAAAKEAGRDLDDCYTIWPVAICVLESGESAISPRALKQAGPLAARAFHFYTCNPEIGPLLPPAIRERLEIFEKEVLSRIDLPRELLYQEVNAGHLEYLLDGEAAVLTEEIIRMTTLTGTAEEIAAQLRRLDSAGLSCVQLCIPSSVMREVILDVEEKIMPLMAPATADPSSGT